MKLKSGLLALGVIASLVLLDGTSAEAQATSTDKKDESVTVKVTRGDTLSSIADEHDTTYVRVFNANEEIAHPDAIDVDDTLRIPDEDEELPDRMAELATPQQVEAPAPVVEAAPAEAVTYNQPAPSAPRGSSAGNTYYHGYCTWYAKEKRPDLPNMLGNGGQWSANAAAQGIPTGSTPRVGAIAEQPGHVAYVEAVNGNMVTVSEMNYAGFGVVSTRTVPASTFHYIY